MRVQPKRSLKIDTGIVLFSGGIFAWLFSGVKFFVQVVPFGGSAWILAWLLLGAGAFVSRSESG